jgi:hypothetical protein
MIDGVVANEPITLDFSVQEISKFSAKQKICNFYLFMRLLGVSPSEKYPKEKIFACTKLQRANIFIAHSVMNSSVRYFYRC